MPEAMPLEASPPLPPEAANQMGKPFAGVGQAMMNDQAKPAGQAHPQGAVLDQAEAVKKVLMLMGQQSPDAKPFVDRMLMMADAMIAKLKTSGPGASAQPAEPPSAKMPDKAEGMAPFPG
jgi:hypothetical protein